MTEPTPLRFSLREVGLDWLDRAPKVLSFSGEIPGSAETIWHELANDASTWPAWFPQVASARYVDPPGTTPALGSRRYVELKGGGKFLETIIAFEPGARYTWRVDSSSLPAFAALVEDWAVEPVDTAAAGGSERAQVTWTFAFQPRLLFQLAGLFASKGMERAFTQALANLEARIAKSPG